MIRVENLTKDYGARRPSQPNFERSRASAWLSWAERCREDHHHAHPDGLHAAHRWNCNSGWL